MSVLGERFCRRGGQDDEQRWQGEQGEQDEQDEKTSKTSKPAKAGPSEETKAKFREALERKNAHEGHASSSDGEGSNIHQAHGPAQAQRMFRRKAGG